MPALLAHWFANGVIAYRRHQAIETFSRLSDIQLRDIGLERFAIADHARASFPWHTFESAPRPSLQPSIQGCG